MTSTDDGQSAQISPEHATRVACVGTGTIGSNWAAYFLSQGLDVVATDPGDGAETRLRTNVDDAWPKLERLGLAQGASRERLRFVDSVEEAVADAQFVQESAPDKEALKIDLVAAIDAACPPTTVIASSSSQFIPSSIASRCTHPERVIVGHPFVPAYLVPLVEVVGGEKTSEHTLDWAVRFYRHIGKRPIRLKKEIEAYVANRLQHVVFEEALRLIDDGICDHDDLEDVMTWGLGLRWATVGLLLHRHLGGGKGGVRHMFDHFGWSGSPGGDVAFIDAVERRWAGQSVADLESWRDDNLLTMLEQLKPDPGRRHDAETDK